ncbi:MAG: hypothetical protein ACI4RP_00235 [Acutalibacteraceae bacterium]
MEIGYYNRNFLDSEIYLHDSVYEGFNYEYKNRQISLKCINRYINKIFYFTFNNVVLANMQSCLFWGGGNTVYDIEVLDSLEQLDELRKIKESNPVWFEGSELEKNKEFIIVNIMLVSGDELVIVCSTVDFREEVINPSEPVKVFSAPMRKKNNSGEYT